MRSVYFDYAATAPPYPDVVKEMIPYLRGTFGNPSSFHFSGQTARVAVEEARHRIAFLIGADYDEVVFTSGGTEANNFALKEVALAHSGKGRHIITTAVEHHAVMETCGFLQRAGFQVTYLPVDQYGLVDPDEVKKSITPTTILISVMHANNETGVILPINEIGKIAREAGVYFHTDAVQTAGHLPINVHDLPVDLLSMSAHKLGGPKGIGALYIRKGTKIAALIHGGEQELKRRAGTENVPGIAGFGKAAQIAKREMDRETKRLTVLRERLTTGLLDQIGDIGLNGHLTQRLPGHINLRIDHVDGLFLLLNLNLEGICISTGSACSSSSINPSHVLTAMGLSPEVARNSVRFSLGRGTTKREVDYVLSVLPAIVAKLRGNPPSILSSLKIDSAQRRDIRRYETERHIELLCRATRIRCLYCPVSSMDTGCLIAEWQLNQ